MGTAYEHWVLPERRDFRPELGQVAEFVEVVGLGAVLFVAGIATGRALVTGSAASAPPSSTERPVEKEASVLAPISTAAAAAPTTADRALEAAAASAAPLVTRPTIAPTAANTGSRHTPIEEARPIVFAKRAIDDGRPADALLHLEAHERAYPHGSLAEERDALRVLALCGAGRSAEATPERDRFLRSCPLSAYADRVQTACSPGARSRP